MEGAGSDGNFTRRSSPRRRGSPGSSSARRRSSGSSEQLSAILEAVSKVSELDLSDVPPTSHPLGSRTPGPRTSRALAQPRRRSSRTRPTVTRTTSGRRRHERTPERAPRRPPADGAWRARGDAVSAGVDTLRLSAEEARSLLDRGELSPRELWDAYRAAIEARDAELHAFLTLVDEPAGDGVPIALKDVITTKGIRTTAGSKILEQLRAGLRRDGRRPLQGGRPAAARQDEHRRVRDGLLDRELRLRPDAEPVGPDARPRRLGRRLGRRGRRRARPLGARLRHRRLGQAPLRLLRQRRAPPDLRHRLPLRDRRLRLEPRPGRARDAHGPRQRDPLRDHQRPRRRERLDHRRGAGGRGPRAGRPRRRADRPAAAAERGRGDRAGRSAPPSRRRSRTRRASAPRSSSASCRSRSTTACPATT